jgi:hypothetical protein
MIGNTMSARGAELSNSSISWGPIVCGALCTTALTVVLISFGTAVGLSVASTSPTWRDTSAALSLLSGLFLILQAIVSFGFGGYVAGRLRTDGSPGAPHEIERTDGFHGVASWALAVVLGALLSASIVGLGERRTAPSSLASSVESPLLSYDLDRLFRAPRRAPNIDLAAERAEAARILLTSSSHSGLSPDDRIHLVQQVSAYTGLTGADAERRVDDVIATSRATIRKSRQTAVILSFSAAAAVLLGAVVAWAAAAAGGHHRDGEPLPLWMRHGDFLTRRRSVSPGVEVTADKTPRPFPD